MKEQYLTLHYDTITDSANPGQMVASFDAGGAELRAIVVAEAAEQYAAQPGTEFQIRVERATANPAVSGTTTAWSAWAKVTIKDGAGALLPDATILTNFDASLVKVKSCYTTHSSANPPAAFSFYKIGLQSYYYEP